MLPDLLKSIAGSFTRWALTGLAAYLVRKGVIEGGSAETIVSGAGIGLATLAWSLWLKYKDRLHFLTAISMSPTSTEEEVKAEAQKRAPGVSVWSVLLLLSLIPASLSLTACEDNQLKAVASNVDRLAVLIADAREVRDELFTQRIIDAPTAYDITVGLRRVNTALKIFNDKAKTYAAAGELTPQAQTDLGKLAKDIADAATELINTGALGIKNPERQAEYVAAISAIKEAALAVYDAIERLKTKAPVQKADAGLIALLPLFLRGLRLAMAAIERERARRGKTYEEVFEDAGLQLEANDVAFVQDLIKYSPGPLPPATNQPE